MAKRPTPKKKRAKSATRTQHSAYIAGEVKRLRNRQNSPYGILAEPKAKASKAIKKIKA